MRGIFLKNDSVTKCASAAEYAAVMGISLALVVALSYIDTIISSAVPIPGVRFGLANIVILAVLSRYGIPSAAVLSLLRSGFAGLTRGFTAGMMSLGGGILSFAASVLLICVLGRSYRFSGIIAAVCHIIGQLAVSCILTGSLHTLLYAPVLIPAAVASGFLTGIAAEAVVKKSFENTPHGKD